MKNRSYYYERPWCYNNHEPWRYNYHSDNRRSNNNNYGPNACARLPRSNSFRLGKPKLRLKLFITEFWHFPIKKYNYKLYQDVKTATFHTAIALLILLKQRLKTQALRFMKKFCTCLYYSTKLSAPGKSQTLAEFLGEAIREWKMAATTA